MHIEAGQSLTISSLVILTKQSRKKNGCCDIQKQLKMFFFYHIRGPFRISEEKLFHTWVQSQ